MARLSWRTVVVNLLETDVVEMARSARHSARLYPADLHRAQKTTADAVSTNDIVGFRASTAIFCLSDEAEALRHRSLRVLFSICDAFCTCLN